MTEYESTLACGCPAIRRRGSSLYRELHTPACRERTRARNRAYAAALRAKFAGKNDVVCSAVPIILEAIPESHMGDGVETVRPVAIPPLDVSFAASRVFESSAYPPVFDWVLVCVWWWMRDRGLLPEEAP